MRVSLINSPARDSRHALFRETERSESGSESLVTSQRTTVGSSEEFCGGAADRLHQSSNVMALGDCLHRLCRVSRRTGRRRSGTPQENSIPPKPFCGILAPK